MKCESLLTSFLIYNIVVKMSILKLEIVLKVWTAFILKQVPIWELELEGTVGSRNTWKLLNVYDAKNG